MLPMVRAAILSVLLMLLPSVANAEKRVALLIGNKDYKPSVGALANPLNDIRVVGEAVKAVGFEVLKPAQNATRAGMLIAIHELASKLKAAGSGAVGFIYYSGHGMASAGENYLIPVDIDEPSTLQLSVQGVKHSEVLAILRNEAPNAAHYLVLDACRNTLQGARGGKGFLPVGQQSGVLVAFSAEPGKTASDMGEGSGPYAAALAAELVKPGQTDLLMFHNVRVAVMDKTHGDQVPWTEDGLQRRQRLLFAGKLQPLAPPKTLEVSEAGQTWATIKETPNRSILEAYVKQFGDTVYGAMARARLDELKKSQLANATPPREQKSPVAAPTASTPAPSPAPKSTQKPQSARCSGIDVSVGLRNERLCAVTGKGPPPSFKDCADCPEMTVVPAGSYLMGSPAEEPERNASEGPQHSVAIAKPFAVGKYEITRDQFELFVSATKRAVPGACSQLIDDVKAEQKGWSFRSPGYGQEGNHPAVCVSWSDAKQYVDWLSKTTKKDYRLPSEAEWEYVARAGSRSRYYFGDEERRLCEFGNVADTTDPSRLSARPLVECRDGYVRTAPVGKFAANAFGLHDTIGNVWEWVEDCASKDYAAAPTDASARIERNCETRVIRGGSWGSLARNYRSAARIMRYGANVRLHHVGFRVVRTLQR